MSTDSRADCGLWFDSELLDKSKLTMAVDLHARHGIPAKLYHIDTTARAPTHPRWDLIGCFPSREGATGAMLAHCAVLLAPLRGKRTDSIGYVYLIGAKGEDLIKIGSTKDSPTKRMKALSTGSPHAMELLGSVETDCPMGLEKSLHRSLADRRTNGEWFRISRGEAMGIVSYLRSSIVPPSCRTYQTIDGRVVLRCEKRVLEDQSIDLVTEMCPFCRRTHTHGGGTVARPLGGIWQQGIYHAGHRCGHCWHNQEIERFVVRKSVELPSGEVIHQMDGYYLAIPLP